jgi:hypothetical protein
LSSWVLNYKQISSIYFVHFLESVFLLLEGKAYRVLDFHFALLALIEIGNLFVAEYFFLSFNLMGCGRGILFGNSRRSENPEFKNNEENLLEKIFLKNSEKSR